jgi:phosphopantetheine adenylyltransferase/dephospho-CoA kinase
MIFLAKLLWEMIEPCADRMSSVEDFLRDIDPSLQYHIVPIYDPFGPTKEDSTFQVSSIFIYVCEHAH